MIAGWVLLVIGSIIILHPDINYSGDEYYDDGNGLNDDENPAEGAPTTLWGCALYLVIFGILLFLVGFYGLKLRRKYERERDNRP